MKLDAGKEKKDFMKCLKCNENDFIFIFLSEPSVNILPLVKFLVHSTFPTNTRKRQYPPKLENPRHQIFVVGRQSE